MTRPEPPLVMTEELAVKLPQPIIILADQRHLDALRMSPNVGWLADSVLLALPIADPLPFDALTNNGLLIVEVDPAAPSSMRRIRQLHERFPDLKIVVAMDSADLLLVRTLVREGVSDVVELPLSPEEVMQTIVAISEANEARAPAQVRLAPVIAVTRALGGTGASTVASNLAVQLAQDGKRVCVFDLDIQFGRMAELFGVATRLTLADLIEAGNRLDGEFLRSVTTRHDSGVALVAAPSEILPIESVEAKDIAAIVALAQRQFDYVVLDVPSSLTNWVLATLVRADRIVIVSQQSIASLQHTRRLLDLFAQLGMDDHRVTIVPNRVEHRMFGAINLHDVEIALRQKVEVSIHDDSQIVEAAQDRGELVSAFRPRSHFASDIRKLAETLLDRLGGVRT